jgi:RNA polymerase sigma factor (TIGR02999 family)
MSEVTRLLSAIEQGDPQAAEQLLPLVYDELRRLAAQKLAREKPGQTLQATALVHEAYLRLVGARAPSAPSERADKRGQWDGRRHFFAAAAEAMRRILIENARRKQSRKHGGRSERIPLDQVDVAIPGHPDLDLLALDDALARLAAERPHVAELVKLRFFTGLTMDEAGQLLGISAATAYRHWNFARAWLFRAISGTE